MRRPLGALLLVAVIASCETNIGSIQAKSLDCVVVVLPSDSGAGRIWSVAPGPRGRLAWDDGRPAQFLLRDSAGRTRVIGRQGSGPGEFQAVGGMGWIGDTLWVADGSAGRVQFFSDTGRYLRVRMALPLASWAPRPDDRLVGFSYRQLAASALPIVVLAHKQGAARRDTVAQFVAAEVEQINVPIGNRDFPNAYPLAPSTEAASDAAHSRFCAAIPLKGGDIQLTCTDDSGRSVLDRRISLPPRPVTDSIYAQVIAGYSKAPGRTAELMRQRISRPRDLPVVIDMKVNQDGEIWLARSHDSESTARWVRIRADGTVRDSVAFPSTYRLVGLQGDTVWAATADSDDLQTLSRCAVK